MSLGIPSPAQVNFIRTPDGWPYVRPVTTNKNLVWASQHEPQRSCLFLIPPEVWDYMTRSKQNAVNELRYLRRSQTDLITRAAQMVGTMVEEKEIQDDQDDVEQNSPPDDLQFRYNELLEEIDAMERRINLLTRYDAFSDILPGTVGYYWSESDKAYYQALVTKVDYRRITIQLGLREIGYVSRDYICTPADYLQLDSQARARRLRLQRYGIDSVPIVPIKL